jgi:hypothetical protein
MNPTGWIKVHTVESIFESDVLKDALDRESIEYMVKEHKDTAYDGIFILQRGFATFFVRQKDEAAAQAVVRQIRNLPYVAFSKD